MSELVTGDLAHSIQCGGTQHSTGPREHSTWPRETMEAGKECGVEQGSITDGFDSGMSFGSAIVLEV